MAQSADLPLAHPAHQDLETAFQVFTAASEQLAEAYRVLERRVARLTLELAAARHDRNAHFAAQERLAERLRGLFEALPGGVVVVDGEGTVQEASANAITLLGDIVVGARWPAVLAQVCKSRGAGEILLHNGRRIALASRALEIEAGEIILLQDVTDVRALQHQLERNRRLSAMGEMAARLAHQLRTPLASSLLDVDHLRRDDLASADRARFAARCEAGLRHLEHLINDMLAFARGDESECLATGVADLLEAFQQTLEPQFRSAGATLQVHNANEPLTVWAHRDALLGALLNIGINALQMGGQGVRLEVQARAGEGNAIEIVLSDDGPGIAEDLQPRIFEPYFTTRPAGTGLGLAVARAVVAAHRGDIFLSSRPGAGSRFIIQLPRDGGPDALPSGGARSWADCGTAHIECPRPGAGRVDFV